MSFTFPLVRHVRRYKSSDAVNITAFLALDIIRTGSDIYDTHTPTCYKLSRAKERAGTTGRQMGRTACALPPLFNTIRVRTALSASPSRRQACFNWSFGTRIHRRRRETTTSSSGAGRTIVEGTRARKSMLTRERNTGCFALVEIAVAHP